MGEDKIVTPGKIIKKDKTIIEPGAEYNTTDILEKEIKMNRLARKTHEAFGVSQDRVAEILKKLIAVAKVYPRYSVIAEVFLNCSDRFTQMERLFGLFILGKMKGEATILRQLRVQLKGNSITATLEQKLLSLLSKYFIIEDPLLTKLLEKN